MNEALLHDANRAICLWRIIEEMLSIMDALKTKELRGKLFLFLLGVLLLIHFICPKAPYPNSDLINFDLLLQSQSEETEYELVCGVFETIEGRSIFHCLEEKPGSTNMATPQSLTSDFQKSAKSLLDYATMIASKFDITKLARAKYAIEFVNHFLFECKKNNIPTKNEHFKAVLTF